MGQSVRVFQVDAFTQRPFTGNPAGVVLDADALSDAQMQVIARELNNGDTVFLLHPDGADHDLRARFFTPRTEVGFVGHATLAAHAVLAAIGRARAPRQKQRTGIVQVDVQDGADPLISIHQTPAPLGRAIGAEELAPVLAALGLANDELDVRCPTIIAGEASTRLLVGVRDAAVLARLKPDLAQLAALSSAVGASGYFLFTLRPAVPDCLTEARMFCPALGIPEDPVSGNAHGMLGVYLLHHDLLPPASELSQFSSAQGHHVGRPGRVGINLQFVAGKLQRVSIAGYAVIVFETTIPL